MSARQNHQLPFADPEVPDRAVLDPRDGRIIVLLVSHSAGLAGAERISHLLAGGLDRNRFHVHATTPEVGPLRTAFLAQGTPASVAAVRWWTRPTSRTLSHFTNDLDRRVEHLARLALAVRADVVLTNTMVVAEGALAAAQLQLPHAWYVHEMLESGDLTPLIDVRMLHRFMHRLSDRVFAASTAVRGELTATECLPEEKIVVANYGLDPAFADGVRASRREHAILFPARLSERKGLLTMLEAFVLVRQRFPAASLILAGEAPRPARKRVREFVKQRALGGVEMIGFTNELRSLMASVDIVALPSVVDPFPVSVLEAMALGKPVVGTFSGGMADQIVDGETGYLVHVGDHVGLAQRIVDLLCDEDRRNRMGAAAARRLRSSFPLESMLATFNGELERLAACIPDGARDAAARELLAMSTRSRLIRAEDRLEVAVNQTIRRIRHARAAVL